jgi:DNA-binding response OmpR family regulator
MANAVLVAEPEPSTRGFLERHLADDGFDVFGAAECGEALELAERARPDLVLLGDTSALEECRSWSREVPLIVLGDPEADAVDRVRALERGADDFLSRPFLYDELLARIRAVLRRTAPIPPELVRVGEIEIDRPTRRVTVAGRRVDLPAKEYELLLKLASDPSRVFTKEELLREVWGFQSLGKTRTLDSHASRLRRKLARAGEEPFVHNVWGVGYRLLGD